VMSHARLWFAVWMLCLAAACGSSSSSNAHAVAAKNYSQKCASVADCFAVYVGPVGCCGGGCPNVAIRADALPKYMSDFNTATHCDVTPPCTPPLSCATGRVECVSGMCQLEAPDASATD
jgi:hypothetical protein